MNLELIEKEGALPMIIVDYQVVPLRNFRDPDGTASGMEAEERRFLGFYFAYQKVLESNPDLTGLNLSSQGWSDLVDLRLILTIEQKGTLILSREEFDKLGGQPLSFRNGKIIGALTLWFQGNQNLITNAQTLAFHALYGEPGGMGQLTPLFVGLKPLCIELPTNDPDLKPILRANPSLRMIPDLDVVYHVEAIDRVMRDHEVIFGNLGLANLTSEELVRHFVEKYNNVGFTPLEHEAFGLLLGYDPQSCANHDNNLSAEAERYQPLDHALPHGRNAVPFNFYGVDYSIDDPDNNPGFQKLKAEYDLLAKTVEEFALSGMSPLQVLQTLGLPQE